VTAKGSRADFLVLSPPATTPSEPPAGAFLLAGGLKARGFTAPLLDLSLEFYIRRLEHSGSPSVAPALRYLQTAAEGFTPSRHRTSAGILHSALRKTEDSGWGITLMDVVPPCDLHSPGAILETCRKGGSPFRDLWEEVLEPVLDDLKPCRVLVSVAYLSQISAAVDLCEFLSERGITALAGGSLFNSLSVSGRGSRILEAVFPSVSRGDGHELTGEEPGAFLRRMGYPDVLNAARWISPHPVVPYAFGTGCYWNRCLFCPDREAKWNHSGEEPLAGFLETVPDHGPGQPMIHFLDSALPPAVLKRCLPVIRNSGMLFFGFARPSRELLDLCSPTDLARAGCAMLQLGAESGSDSLLRKYDKGFDTDEWEWVVQSVSAAGIRTYLYLLFGLPGETEDHRRATLQAVTGLSESIDFLNLSLFNLPRFCELSDRAGEFGIDLIPDSPRHSEDRIALYSEFTEEGRIPRREARLFLSRIASRDPVFRKAMIRTPRWFRAAHPAQMLIPGRRPPGRDAHGIREG
jgi:hypothetical protein